jgi:DNA-binding CsgD family transcriptional regulator
MQEKLTPRELEVLQLIAQGKSTKEVACSLGITFKTAACHRQHIREKTGISNAVNLVLFAVRSGLVAEHPSSPICRERLAPNAGA